MQVRRGRPCDVLWRGDPLWPTGAQGARLSLLIMAFAVRGASHVSFVLASFWVLWSNMQLLLIIYSQCVYMVAPRPFSHAVTKHFLFTPISSLAPQGTLSSAARLCRSTTTSLRLLGRSSSSRRARGRSARTPRSSAVWWRTLSVPIASSLGVLQDQ